MPIAQRLLLATLASVSLAATAPLAVAASSQGVPSQEDIAHALSSHGLKMRGIPTLESAPAAKPKSNPAMVPARAPASAPPPSGETRAARAQPSAPSAATRPMISLSTIQFAFDSAKLLPQSIETLQNLGNALNQQLKTEKKFLIEGHTDAYGSAAYNMKLSQRRAAAVKDYLVHDMGVAAARLETVGKGETDPIDPKDPYAGQNRRVVVINLGA